MESPPQPAKSVPVESPPQRSGDVTTESRTGRHGVEEKPKRMNFWVPASLYRQLEREARQQGMTMSAWVQVALLKRPEKVVEKTVLPSGTHAKLAQIPVLEKRVTSLIKERDASLKHLGDANALLAAIRREIGDGVIHARCPTCKEPVRMTMDELLKLLKQPVLK